MYINLGIGRRARHYQVYIMEIGILHVGVRYAIPHFSSAGTVLCNVGGVKSHSLVITGNGQLIKGKSSDCGAMSYNSKSKPRYRYYLNTVHCKFLRCVTVKTSLYSCEQTLVNMLTNLRPCVCYSICMSTACCFTYVDSLIFVMLMIPYQLFIIR